MKRIIVVRFTNSNASTQVNDLELPISINLERDDVNKLINVKWLRSTIRSKVRACSNKRLRFIYNGRVLNDYTDFKKDVIEPSMRQNENDADNQQSGRIYIHCLIAEDLTSNELKEEDKLDERPQQRSTGPEVIGFDRLLLQGFSQQDINDLRLQFHQIYGSSHSSSGRNDQIQDLEESEREQQHIRELEERWIDSTVNASDIPAASTAAANQPVQAPPLTVLEDLHTNEELLLGLLIGIFLGVVGIVFTLADDTVFNKRQKMAIIGGVFLNISFAILRGQWI